MTTTPPEPDFPAGSSASPTGPSGNGTVGAGWAVAPSLAGMPGWYSGAPVTVDDALLSGRALVAPRWGVADALGAILGALVLAVVAAVALAAAPPVPGGVSLLVGLLVPWLALAGWPVLATRLRGNGPVIDLGIRFRRTDLLWGLGGGIVALVLGLLAGLVTQSLLGEFDSAAGDAGRELAASGQWPALVVFAVLVAVGAPIVEELAFRGLLFASLAKARWPMAANVVATTAAFAVFHFEPTRLLVLLVIGATLTVVRWRSRSVGASMIAHAVNNLPGAIGLLLV